MIAVWNLNPCLDKTLFLSELPDHGIHSALRIECITGGKGANVARVLKTLGEDFRLWMPLAGEQGQLAGRLLEEEGIPFSCCITSGQTREVVTLADESWHQLAVKEPGPVLDEAEAREVTASALKIPEGTTLAAVCGGAGCPALYRLAADIVRHCHKLGIPVLLDASGETLRLGLEERPDYVKPNLEEAAALGYTGAPEEILRKLPVPTPLLSMGRLGLLTRELDHLLLVIPPEITEINPVGSGDSFVAGFLAGLHRGSSFREALRLATACGAANASEGAAALVRPSKLPNLMTGTVFEEVPLSEEVF